MKLVLLPRLKENGVLIKRAMQMKDMGSDNIVKSKSRCDLDIMTDTMYR